METTQEAPEPPIMGESKQTRRVSSTVLTHYWGLGGVCISSQTVLTAAMRFEETAMPNPCYYHPAVAAAGTCVQCGAPGCGESLTQIGDKLACRRCAAAVQGKLGMEPIPPPSVRPLGPAKDERRLAASGTRNYMAQMPEDTLTPSKFVMGIALAFVVGVLGAVGVEKVMFYSGHGIALLYVVLGFMVSASLWAFTRRGGQALALTATGVLLVCLAVNHLVYAQDVLNQLRASGDLGPGVTLIDVLPVALGNLKFAHWLFVLGSVITCLVTANQEAK